MREALRLQKASRLTASLHNLTGFEGLGLVASARRRGGRGYHGLYLRAFETYVEQRHKQASKLDPVSHPSP